MKSFIALALGLLIASTPHAQTLADALEHAWARHPQAAALDAHAAAARAQGELAAGRLPSAPAMAWGGLRGEHGRQEWEVELAAPLWLPGQQAARIRVAERALDEVSARRDALRLALAGELRTLWWDVAAARAAHAQALRQSASARALEADVAQRHRAGELARMDANLARAERLRAEAGLRAAEHALTAAEAAWLALAGHPAPARLQEETAMPPEHVPDAAHPRLRALAAAASSARATLEQAHTGARDAPELAVRLVRERGDDREPWDHQIGVKLKIPLASPPRRRLAEAEARAVADGADAERALADERLALEARTARAALDAAEIQVELARARAALAADNRALAEKGFALGELDLSTLLRARAAADEADATLASQQVARAAAHSRLLQALGVLP